jgi:prepilin-type N-terminal cleavage/methylation domain-containing protein
MKFADIREISPPRRSRRGFTLIEVLASLLLMAIVIPVAMQAVSIASRAGTLGQRKVAAVRIAERLIEEMIVTGQADQNSTTGTVDDGDFSYAWALESSTWTEDTMTHLTVKVTFAIQGIEYDVSASTLFDPNAATPASTTTTTQ